MQGKAHSYPTCITHTRLPPHADVLRPLMRPISFRSIMRVAGLDNLSVRRVATSTSREKVSSPTKSGFRSALTDVTNIAASPAREQAAGSISESSKKSPSFGGGGGAASPPFLPSVQSRRSGLSPSAAPFVPPPPHSGGIINDIAAGSRKAWKARRKASYRGAYEQGTQEPAAALCAGAEARCP